MRFALPASLFFVLAAPAAAAPCRVGVEARTISDARRQYGDTPRPIRVVLWYPAAAAAPHPVTRSMLAGADWVSHTDARTGGAAADHPPAPAGCAGWREAPRAGRFPLVLLGSGLGARAYFHAALAEALADAGFVVAFVSVLGPAPGVAPAFDAGTMRLLAADATHALAALADDPRVDRGRAAAVAWSAGTVVHLLVARDRPEIAAGVSLDGGVAYDYGPKLWTGVAATPPRAMPYLHLAAGVRGPVPLDDTLIAQLGARVQVVEGLSHAQFTDAAPGGSPEVERARASVRRAVVEFLGGAFGGRLGADAPRRVP